MSAVPLHLTGTASLTLGFLLLLSLCLDPGQAKELKFVTLVSTHFFSHCFSCLPESQRNQMSPCMFPLCYLPKSRHCSDSESEESHKFVLRKIAVSFAVDGTVSLQLPSGPMPSDWQVTAGERNATQRRALFRGQDLAWPLSIQRSLVCKQRAVTL